MRMISELSHEEFFKKFAVKYHGYGFSYIDGCYGRTRIVDKNLVVDWLYSYRPIGMTKKMIKDHLQEVKREWRSNFNKERNLKEME